MVVGLLAILKAGGAVLPLDPTYPARSPEVHGRGRPAPTLITDTREGLAVRDRGDSRRCSLLIDGYRAAADQAGDAPIDLLVEASTS